MNYSKQEIKELRAIWKTRGVRITLRNGKPHFFKVVDNKAYRKWSKTVSLKGLIK